MAVLDILGQPTAGVIGGKVDLGVDPAYVNNNLVTAYRESITKETEGLGRDADQTVVSDLETLTADKKAVAAVQAVPLALVAAGLIVLFVLFSKKGK